MELRGKNAVITGASGRLGGGIALALAEAGCNCICHYNSNKDRAERLVKRIQRLGAGALAVGADLTKTQQIEELFERAKQHGVPQILINSAAVFSRQALGDVTFEEAERVLRLNLAAPVMVSRVFAEKLKSEFGETGSVVGKIINVSDVGGIRPWAEYVLYCSSKAALNGATKALAKGLAPSICVNSIAPGVVTWPEDFDEVQKRRQLSFIPAGRIAETSEIAEAIIFLLKNDYITGQVLNVDGGRCI